MRPDLKVRPSFLPLLNKCPMAGDAPSTETLELIPIGINARRQGRLGQGFHELMKICIPTGVAPTGQQIEDMAIQYAVDFKELFVLCSNGWNWWTQLSSQYREPILEVTMSSGIIEGTPDLVSLNDGIEGRGLDWKSGFVLRDHTEQMEAYIWLLLQKYPAMQRVYWLVINVRTGRLIPFRRTREQSDRWYERTIRYLNERRYVVNNECDSCPRCVTCPAIKGWITQASESIGKTLVAHEMGEPVDLLASYETADFLARVAERYHTATKALLAAGGPVKYDTREVRSVETVKEHLVSSVVLRVLLTEYGVTAEQLCASLKFTKSSLYEYVLADLARASGEKIKDFTAAFYDLLRKEGGIETTSSHSVEVEHFDVENPSET
jgi:hypothetical protein